jgi:predicted transposase YdaD
LEKAETEIEFERRLSLIETILANKFPDLTKEMIMQILDLKQMDITQSLFYQEIIQEGRQEGEAGLVIRLLRRRLGQLADNHVEQIQN